MRAALAPKQKNEKALQQKGLFILWLKLFLFGFATAAAL